MFLPASLDFLDLESRPFFQNIFANSLCSKELTHQFTAGNGSRTRDIDLGKVALYH